MLSLLLRTASTNFFLNSSCFSSLNPFSSDSDSENKVQQAIKELMKKRTTIIITHRLSSIKHTDKILVIDKGEICQSGNHEKLMLEKDGVYYKLNQLQYLN